MLASSKKKNKIAKKNLNNIFTLTLFKLHFLKCII